ncbi:hypothetical protein, partial [Desulfofundulus sp.]|uniref:hypothetical protein n=1 Tax=Desulfofundulus sp. TaxID=2282750 RepID=UPI003C77B370
LMSADADVQAVHALFSDGTGLTRRRTRTGTGGYEIRRPGEEPVVLTGVGRHLPPEVIGVHRTPPVDLAGESLVLNIAGQFDPVFLIGHPNSVNLALLDNLTNNDTASAVLKQLRSAADSCKRRLAVCNQQRESTAEQVSVTNQIAALARPVAALYEEYEQCLEQLNHLASLCDLAERWHKLRASVEAAIGLWEQSSPEERLAQAGAALESLEASTVEYQTVIMPFIGSYNLAVSGYLSALGRLDLAGFAEAYSDYRHLLATTSSCPLCGGEFHTTGLLVALDGDYSSVSADIEDMCGLEVQLLSTVDEDLIARLKQARQAYEACRSDILAAVRVLSKYRADLDTLSEECLTRFGTRPEDLEERVRALAGTLEESLATLASSLEAIKRDYQQLAARTGLASTI